MAEFEELRITVRLVDQASTSLRQFQQQMKETATGPTSQHMEAFAKKGEFLKQGIKAMGLEAKGTTALLENMGTKLLGVGGSVATLVTAIAIATERVGKLASSFNEASRSWEAMGTSLAHGKNISEQLARIGIDEQKSMQLTANAIQQHVQAQKRGLNEQFRELRMRFGEQFEEEYKKAIAVAKTPEQYLTAAAQAEKKVGEIVERNLKGQSREEIDAQKAYAQERFRTITGFSDELHLVTQLQDLDAEREKFWNKMDENAKKIADDWRNTWENINQIWQLLKGDLFDPDKSPFPAMMHAARVATDEFFAAILKGQQLLEGHNFWQDFFKFMVVPSPFNFANPAGGAVNWMLDYFRKHGLEQLPTPPTIPGGIPGGGAVPFAALPGANGEDMDQNTRELKRLNDQLYEMLHPPETSGDLATRGGYGSGDAIGGTGGVAGGTPGPAATTPGRGDGGTGPAVTTPPGGPKISPLGFPSPGSFGGSLGSFTPGGNAQIIGGGDLGAFSRSSLNPPKSPNLFGGPTPGAQPFIPSGREGGGAGADAPTYKAGGDDIPTNLLAFTRGIGITESDFNRKEAYNERLNLASNNANVRRLGPRGADYGFYQMNATDVDEAVNKHGMSPDQARHLSGGGAGGKSSLDDQTYAVATYLARAHPDAVRKLTENNDFAGMQRAVGNKWFGPRDHPGKAQAEQNRVIDAARVSGAALLGGSTSGSQGHGSSATVSAPPSGDFDVHKVRTTLDSRNAKQSVEAAGHLRIEVPGGELSGGRATATQLFNQTPMNRQTQMQPATSGPAEPARQGGLNPPSH